MHRRLSRPHSAGPALATAFAARRPNEDRGTGTVTVTSTSQPSTSAKRYTSGLRPTKPPNGGHHTAVFSALSMMFVNAVTMLSAVTTE